MYKCWLLSPVCKPFRPSSRMKIKTWGTNMQFFELENKLLLLEI